MNPRYPYSNPDLPRLRAMICALFLASLFAGFWPGSAGAQLQDHIGEIKIEPAGTLWLEGSASIVDYRCYAESLEGADVITGNYRPSRNIQGEGGATIRISLPIRTLECGKEKMNRDMYDALKAEQHPDITYRLNRARVMEEGSDTDPTNWMNIRTEGLLSIAGVTDSTEWVVQARQIGENNFRVRGSFPLNMNDFNVTPPTALLGLIRASEELTVHFDVSVLLQE